jgi:Zn-dependent M16 (insulinase) family peptidase
MKAYKAPAVEAAEMAVELEAKFEAARAKHRAGGVPLEAVLLAYEALEAHHAKHYPVR